MTVPIWAAVSSWTWTGQGLQESNSNLPPEPDHSGAPQGSGPQVLLHINIFWGAWKSLSAHITACGRYT